MRILLLLLLLLLVLSALRVPLLGNRPAGRRLARTPDSHDLISIWRRKRLVNRENWTPVIPGLCPARPRSP